MSAKTDLRLAVLKVLSGQSPGYFIFPNAAAFIADGLQPGDVAEVLEELHADGKVERELLVLEEEPQNGNEPTAIPGGYRLLDDDEIERQPEGDPMSEHTDPTIPPPGTPPPPPPDQGDEEQDEAPTEAEEGDDDD